MKKRVSCLLTSVFWTAILLVGSAAPAEEAILTVLNPRGIQPPIRLIPMAPRLNTLDGKTIYVVDTGYPLTQDFVQEIQKVLTDRYPNTNWVHKRKLGRSMTDDPELWAEIKEKGQGMIMAIGH